VAQLEIVPNALRKVSVHSVLAKHSLYKQELAFLAVLGNLIVLLAKKTTTVVPLALICTIYPMVLAYCAQQLEIVPNAPRKVSVHSV
jgi:hypothetical protein